jgi:hypothetical protein
MGLFRDSLPPIFAGFCGLFAWQPLVEAGGVRGHQVTRSGRPPCMRFGLFCGHRQVRRRRVEFRKFDIDRRDHLARERTQMRVASRRDAANGGRKPRDRRLAPGHTDSRAGPCLNDPASIRSCWSSRQGRGPWACARPDDGRGPGHAVQVLRPAPLNAAAGAPRRIHYRRVIQVARPCR